LTDAIAYELDRQQALLDAGERIIQDTMGWSETRQETFSQRGKEEAHDYRYFPEPDLPPLAISSAWVEEVKASLPELPDAKVARYLTEYMITPYEANVLIEERSVAEWYEATVVAGGDPATVANWMINILFSLMNEHKLTIEQIKIMPAQLVELLSLVEEGIINNNTAKEVLADMFTTGRSAKEIVAEKGLAQISDEDQINTLIAQVLVSNPEQVSDYLGGKEQLRGWFVGQVMRASRGKANPALVNKLLTRQLSELKEAG
jgi:aspartyl-tRNA(Asn)/glutamyl-tRNA(Gln) amidotransferase subunit B